MKAFGGPESLTCYDVLGDIPDAMRDVLRPDQQYYALGGIPSGAILHPDSVYDHQSSTLVAAPGSSQPLHRERNGSLRDIDVLVLDVLDEAQARKAHAALECATDGQLVVSVFGLTPFHQDIIHERLRRVAWTSKRTTDEKGGLGYELYPLYQPVSRRSYDPWMLQTPPGTTLPMLNPAAHTLAYRMRSISGLRYKDNKKVTGMEWVIASDPKFVEQVEDGELRTWKAFAEGIRLLGDVNLAEISLGALARMHTSDVAFLARSRILRRLESSERIIKLAQQGVLQDLLRPFVGAK